MKKWLLIVLIPLLLRPLYAENGGSRVISLSWAEVVNKTRADNLQLSIQEQDYRHQRLNEWQALADFLPELSYRFQGQKNLELPEFVLSTPQGPQRLRIGTTYNFSHILQLQYPLFTGGARLANWRIQKNLKKSLRAQLQFQEESTVLSALEAYFNLMLSQALIEVNLQAYETARANFNQVEKFYRQGAASRLDYLRAKSNLSAALPQLTSARNARKVAGENLKFILNIDPQDSLILLDSLQIKDFLQEFSGMETAQLQEIGLASRSDLQGAAHQRKAVQNQKLVAVSRFLPSVVFTANVQHQAQLNESNVAPDDFTRAKTAAISLQLPLFEGGARAISYQQARIQNKQADLQYEQFRRSVMLEVESQYLNFRNAAGNLSALQDATAESREALRLSNLTYSEGIGTQVDVLGTQLNFTTSQVRLKQGIFDYIISQLRLLKAMGKLNTIWN
ncbi:MAG: TolC family protein [Calditrichia bacterium]